MYLLLAVVMNIWVIKYDIKTDFLKSSHKINVDTLK